MSSVTTKLYAFVDDETAVTVARGGILLPNGPFGLVWMTDYPTFVPGQMPQVAGGARKVGVDNAAGVSRWLDVQHDYPMDEWMQWELGAAARPDHWYISPAVVPVTLLSH